MRVLRWLTCFVFLALLHVAAIASGKVALVIGNGAYQNTVALPNPPNDAQDMASELEKLGFKVISGTNLTQAEMVTKIGDFDEAARDADLTLFFYAGHGLQVNGLNYLVPIDAKLERPTSLQYETIETSLVLNAMTGPGRTAVALLDACRNNPLSRSFSRSVGKSRGLAVGQGLAPPTVGAGGMIIGFSTAPGEVAADGEGRNSPFTAALLKNIGTPGLEIQQLMTRVKADVYSATKETQEPWHNSSLRNELYLVAPQSKAAAAEVPAPAPAAEAPTAKQSSSVEFEWNAVKDTENPAALQAFMDKYKDDPLFLALADERMHRLVGNGAGAGAGTVAAEGDSPPDAAADAGAQTGGESADLNVFLAQALDIATGNNTAPKGLNTLELGRPSTAPGAETAGLGLKRVTTAASFDEFMQKVPDAPNDFPQFAVCRASNLRSSGCEFMQENFTGAVIQALEKAGLLGDGTPDLNLVKINGTEDIFIATRPQAGSGDPVMAVALIAPDLTVKRSFRIDLSKAATGIDAGDEKTRFELMGAMTERDDTYLSIDAGFRCRNGKPIKRRAGVLVRFSLSNLQTIWTAPFNVSDINMVANCSTIYTATVGSCAPSYIYGIDKKTGTIIGRDKLPNGADKLMLVGNKIYMQHYPKASVYKINQ